MIRPFVPSPGRLSLTAYHQSRESTRTGRLGSCHAYTSLHEVVVVVAGGGSIISRPSCVLPIIDLSLAYVHDHDMCERKILAYPSRAAPPHPLTPKFLTCLP